MIAHSEGVSIGTAAGDGSAGALSLPFAPVRCRMSNVGNNASVTFPNLLGETAPTLLPDDPTATELADGAAPADVARAHPASPLPWAVLAEDAMGRGDDLVGYAFARVGYHRGLDALRRAGWKGHGPIPFSHEPNQGFLRCLAALAEASDRIGDAAEAKRCREFLTEAGTQPRS